MLKESQTAYAMKQQQRTVTPRDNELISPDTSSTTAPSAAMSDLNIAMPQAQSGPRRDGDHVIHVSEKMSRAEIDAMVTQLRDPVAGRTVEIEPAASPQPARSDVIGGSPTSSPAARAIEMIVPGLTIDPATAPADALVLNANEPLTAPSQDEQSLADPSTQPAESRAELGWDKAIRPDDSRMNVVILVRSNATDIAIDPTTVPSTQPER
jgi:hypothetical protein